MNTDDDFKIRDFRDNDYNEVVQFWELTGLGNPERGDNLKIIQESVRIGGKMLVMEEKTTGKICGTSWMTFDGRRIFLHHFGILPELQGKGLSKNLLQASLQFVKEKGYQLKLEVHKTNFKAINLYKKSGFKLLDGYDVYILRDLSQIQF